VKYDVHTHIGLDAGFYLRGWWPYASTAADLLLQMDAQGIDRAVALTFVLPSAFDAYAFAERNEVALLPGRFPFDRENELLHAELARVDSKHRLMQFAMFDPSREVARQVESLERLFMRGKPPIFGLKTQSTVIRSPIRALLDEGRPIMELAAQYKMPVLFHTSVNDPWAQVADCLDVAQAFPTVRFNLAHSLRFHERFLRTAAELPNVWVDCAAHLAHCELARNDSPAVAPAAQRVKCDYAKPVAAFEAIHAILGPNKYLWGSDNPFMSWCDDKLRMVYTYKQEMAVVNALTEAVRCDVLSDGPTSWLFDGREPA
jgi:predicted TIM-barrel fold metal-dependent hydrolase